MTIQIGWWAIPAIITIVAGWTAYESAPNEAGHYGAGGVVALLYFGCAFIVSLVAWLVWALLA